MSDPARLGATQREAKIPGPATLALERWEKDEGEAVERLGVVRRDGGEGGGVR